MRGLPATLAFRFCVVPAHLFGLCYDHVFAFDYFGWIGMLCWETSQYLPCVVINLAMPLPPIGRPPSWLRDFDYWYSYFPGLAIL